MIFLKVLIALVSTAAFLSLSLYIYLVARGDSLTLYSTMDNRLLSLRQKIFICLAMIGLIACMYSGAEKLLFWMPSEWGSIDSEGEYQAARTTLATIFAIYAGFTLAAFLDKANHEKFYIVEALDKTKELEKILEASLDMSKLEKLKNEYVSVSQGLRASAKERSPLASTMNSHLFPEGRRAQVYAHLISLIDNHQVKLRSA